MTTLPVRLLESPTKRVPVAQRRASAAALKELGRLEEAAAQEMLDLLAKVRRDILSALADATGYQSFHLMQLLNAVDQAIAQGRARADQLASGLATDAFNLGIDLIGDVLDAAELQIGFVGVSHDLLQATIDVTSDQIRAVWSELGSRLKIAIRRAALGVQNPFETMQVLANVIKDSKTFGSALGRAEAIVRTEVGRTFALAGQSRMTQANERLNGGLKKYWLSAEDGRVRPTHEAADLAYSPDGGSIGPIDVDKPFIVGGARLMQPLDPSGPPEETINCRCVSVPFVSEELMTRAA